MIIRMKILLLALVILAPACGHRKMRPEHERFREAMDCLGRREYVKFYDVCRVNLVVLIELGDQCNRNFIKYANRRGCNISFYKEPTPKVCPSTGVL